MTEEWRDAPGYEGVYQVSDQGRVRSLDWVNARGYRRRGCVLACHPNRQGYLRVRLRTSGKAKNTKVHRLVARAFLLPSAPDQTDVNHINGLKADNRACNLEWCTRSENMLHAYRLGLQPILRGEKHGSAKLCEVEVREIFRLAWQGGPQRQIAEQFGVSMNTVSDIKQAKKWKHITGPLLAAKHEEEEG